MVIEWLTYKVPPPLQDAFLAADDAVWTAALAVQPGYLGKDVWRAAEAPDRLNLIIRWESRAAWKAVPPALLAETEARFRAAFTGEATFQGCTDLDVLPGGRIGRAAGQVESAGALPRTPGYL